MSYPSNSESVAQDQIKAFVERILRLREAAKDINTDIREVYAEAKGNGFDKTVLGKLVVYVEKRSTKAAEMAEADAIFDLYLAAYDGTPSRTHAHARETDMGRVGQSGQPATEVERSAVSGSRPDASSEERDPRAGSNPAPVPLNQEFPATVEGSGSTGGTDVGDGGDAGLTLPAADEAEPSPKVEASSVEPTTDFIVFYETDADGRCLKPELCGSNSRLGVCEACLSASGQGGAQ